MKPILTLKASIHQAEDYLSKKKYQEAIAVCQEALKIQPNLNLYKILGAAFQMQGELKTAFDYYLKALDIKPDDAEVYTKIASIYAQQEQWKDAIISYQVTLRLKPVFAKEHPSLFEFLVQFSPVEKIIFQVFKSQKLYANLLTKQEYIRLGEELENQQNTKLAIFCYRQALKEDPKLFKAYQKLGNLLIKNQEWLTAVNVYKKAVNFYPNYCWFYNHLGIAFMNLKEWELAINLYNKSIQLNPDFAWSYYQLAIAKTHINEWENAKAIYQQLLQRFPDFQPAYFKLIEVLMYLEEPEEIIRIYNPDVYNNNNVEFYLKLLQFFIKHKKTQEVVKLSRHMIEIECNSWWYFNTLGELFGEVNCWNESILAYKKAIEINPSCDYSYKILGDSLEKQSRFSEAIAIYQKACQINSCIFYYIRIGKLLIKQHQYQGAIPYFIEALREQPEHLGIYMDLSLILEKQGHFQEYWDCKGLAILPKFWLSLYLKLSDNLWVNTEDIKTKIQFFPIFSAREVEIKPPKTIDSRIHINFSRLKLKSTEAFVASIPDGRAWSSSVSSAVITSDNQLVSNLSTGSGELFWGLKNIPSLLEIDENVLFLSVQFGQIYYHWFFDILPRIFLIKKSGFDFNNIDKIIVNRCQSSYEKETLQILGIPENKIIESSKFPYIKASQLIVPSPLRGPIELKTPQWSINFLRKTFLIPEHFSFLSSKRIYITRKQAQCRKVINEEEVIQLLTKFDVESVTLESMTVKEQVSCMSNAEVVIAPHGSGLTNLVFCRPGTKVIEFVVPSYPVICYWELSGICQLDYYYLIGESLKIKDSQIDFGEDIYINLKSLEKILQLAGIT